MDSVIFLIALAAAPAAPPTVQDLGWLTGCWSLTRGSRTIEEHWTRPAGGTLLGMARTVEGERTVEYEHVIIRQGPNGLEYVARPSGQAEAVFASTRVSLDEVVFENPQHDFPTRIAYRRQADGLLASAHGMARGQPRTLEFAYRAVSCGR